MFYFLPHMEDASTYGYDLYSASGDDSAELELDELQQRAEQLQSFNQLTERFQLNSDKQRSRAFAGRPFKKGVKSLLTSDQWIEAEEHVEEMVLDQPNEQRKPRARGDSRQRQQRYNNQQYAQQPMQFTQQQFQQQPIQQQQQQPFHQQQQQPYQNHFRQQNQQRSRKVCSHCRALGHEESTCWLLHPEMKPGFSSVH